MLAEGPKPQAEQPQKDPVQEARVAFNKELFGTEYTKGALLNRTLQLQNALLKSQLSPERIYHELTIVSGQGADRAEMVADNETATALREMRSGFELTYETFKPRIQTDITKPAQPTQIQNLPPMKSVKGGEMNPSTPTKPKRKTKTSQEKETTPTKSQEETVGSFLKQKRTEAGLSQGKLGKEAGNMPQTVISQIERGHLPSDPNKISQLASSLGLNEDDIQKLMDLYRKQLGSTQNPPQQ